MQHRPIIVDVDEDVVIEEIPSIMLTIIILRIHKKGKSHFTARKKKGLRKRTKKIYIVNPPRLKKRLSTYME